jgi:hypothetical protein
LAGATSGVAYTTALMASGGTAPYTWSLVTNGGSLPPGLTLPASGIISGTPTATGTFSFTVQVKDSSQQTASKSLSLSVASAPSNASCTYYVSPSGSDSNSGTASAPWKTAQKAFNAAAAGQTVCFRGGTYPQTVTSGYQQTMNNSGSAGSPIVFTNYPGEIAVIQGSTKIYGSYLTFKGTPATAGHCDASSPCGLVFEGSQGYYVDNVDLMYNHDVTFDHVEIRFGNYHAGFYQEGCNNAIIGSYVHDNGSQNVNEDNGIYWSTTPGGCTNGGRIFNNLVEHNYSKGIQLYSSGSSSTPANVLVYENTSIKNGSYGAAIWGDNNVVANNIFYMNGAASGSNQVTWQTGSHQVVDHNLTWGPDSSHSGYYMAGGVCCLTNNQQADPLFINPSSLDWHLTSSSPAIGWSNSSYVLPVDKDNNPRGPGYDAGAYQH